MISPAHALLMAEYNRWQNRSIYASADALSDHDRRSDQGAFFGSIHATLAHLLWADRIWMHRFADMPPPGARSPKESVEDLPDWDDLLRDRRQFDDVIVEWAARVTPDWLGGDLNWYSGAVERHMTRPRWRLLAHFFNHQAHHRGQVHAMLTGLGATPEATDLMLMP